MPLPKRHAEVGRVIDYYGYFYFSDVAGPFERPEAGHGAEQEEASGARWETQHHIRKRDYSFPTARGQAKSQRASKLGRLHGTRQQAPSTWRWVRASARQLISHGRMSYSRQPATWTFRGRGNVQGCTGRSRRPVSAKWAAQAHSHGFGTVRTRCLKETSDRRMSNDMYGRLSGKPDGTTHHADVANVCLPAGQCSNKTQIFISGVSETRNFLPWRSDGPTKGRVVVGRPMNSRSVQSRCQCTAVP